MSNEHPTVVCCECGKIEKARYMEPTRTEMVKQKLCFNCHFWLEKVQWAKNGDITDDENHCIRVGGAHFVANELITGRLPRFGVGFGGTLFRFFMKDGRTIESNNVWSQGTIPEHFRDRLPDNCTKMQNKCGNEWFPKDAES